MRRALLVVAKEPVPGEVKTRLGDLFPAEAKVEFYQALLLDTLRLMGRVPRVDRGILYTPASAAGYFRRIAPAGFQLRPQRGPGLAHRLLNAFDEFIGQGYEQVVIMDSDSPTLPAEYLARAFDLLEQRDVVFGPCEDGGYYLVGARGAHPELFLGVPMSTPAVLRETLARARRAGLSYGLLPAWHDVDLPADVFRLWEEVRQDGRHAPHSAQFLRDAFGAERACMAAEQRMENPWDAGAEAYARYADTPAGRLRFTLIAETLTRHLPPPPLRVLDAGCGTGEMARFLAGRGDHVVGVDSSAGMIHQASERAARLPPAIRRRLDLRLGDLEASVEEFGPEAFDLVLAHAVLDYAPAREAMWTRLLTPLRIGGIISIVRINQPSLALKAALASHDLGAARAALDDECVRSSMFPIAGRAVSEAGAVEEMERAGLSVAAIYGIRAFADYLPALVRDDPGRWEALLELERELCDRPAYRALARYLHLVGTKGASPLTDDDCSGKHRTRREAWNSRN